jgi:hypothetical protein
MRKLLRFTLPLATVLFTALVAADDGKPQTLLGKWMGPNVGVPRTELDFDTLQKSLKLVADKPPPVADYPRWSAMARAGVTAAGKKSIPALSKSCNDCHDTYRAKYRREQANRPFP